MAETSYLIIEPKARAVERGDCTLRCTMTAGFDERFLDASKYELDDGATKVPASSVALDDDEVVITFPRPFKKGDSVWM